MKVLSILALCLALANASTLESFILSIRDPSLRWDMLQKLSQSPGGIPANLEQILIKNNIPYPGMKTQKYTFKGMEKLSASEMQAITYYLDEYYRRQNYARERFDPKPIPERRPAIPCFVDADCPPQQICFDMKKELSDQMSVHGVSSYFEFAIKSLGVKDKECSPRLTDFVVNDGANLIPFLKSGMNKIGTIFNKMHGEKGMEHFLNEVEVKIFKKFDFKTKVEDKLQKTRQGLMQPYNHGGHTQHYQQPFPIELLILTSLLGSNSSDSSELLLLTLFSDIFSAPSGVVGGSTILNPFLLLSLTGNSNTNDLIPVILLSSFLGPGAGAGGGAADLSFILPLLVLQNNNGNSNIDLITLLLLSNSNNSPFTRTGHTGQQVCATGLGGSNPLITYLLFDSILGGNNGLNDSSLLIFLLLGNQGCGTGGLGFAEIILLQNLLNGTSSLFGSNSLIPLLLLSGLGTGGHQGIDQNLLMLFLFDDSLNGTDLLTILFLSDPNFANSPLALLVLFNNNNNNLGGNNNLLPILLLLTQGNSGLSGRQTISTSPVGVTSIDASLPPPGGPLQSPPGVGLFDSRLGQSSGFGLFELILFSQLSGNTLDSTTLFLIILLTQGGLVPNQPVSPPIAPFPVGPPIAPGPPAQIIPGPQPIVPQPIVPQPQIPPQPQPQFPPQPQPQFPPQPQPQFPQTVIYDPNTGRCYDSNGFVINCPAQG